VEENGLMSLTETWSQPTPGILGGALRTWRFWQSPSPSLAVVPGEAATRDALRHEEAREALIALVHRFAAYGLSWTGGESAKITAATQQAAEAFLRALPAGKAFPKISPDGEGGLMMVWEGAGDPLLLTIDNLRLHAVVAAATPRANYIDDLPFDWAQVIPQWILDVIPAR
jgi:hypothetical protein